MDEDGYLHSRQQSSIHLRELIPPGARDLEGIAQLDSRKYVRSHIWEVSEEVGQTHTGWAFEGMLGGIPWDMCSSSKVPNAT